MLWIALSIIGGTGLALILVRGGARRDHEIPPPDKPDMPE